MERVKELLKNIPNSLRSGIESQKAYIARLHSMSPMCWSCAKPVSYYEAVGEDYDLDIYRGDKEKFTCPHCKADMTYCVPFFAGTIPWYWDNPLKHKKG
jgi:transcription initiation factor IIE alpha subunit